MAGTLVINEELCWMPAGWVFDNAIEHIARGLAGTDSALAQVLLDARTTKSVGYLDLRTMQENKFATVVDAADEAIREVETVGASVFGQSAFFPGYLDQFRRLQKMLHLALVSRAKGSPQTAGVPRPAEPLRQ
jgi:hypothetical protein